MLSSTSEGIDLAMVGPLEVSMERVLFASADGTLSALLGVAALKSTPANTWGLSSVDGNPIRQAPSCTAPFVRDRVSIAAAPCSQAGLSFFWGPNSAKGSMQCNFFPLHRQECAALMCRSLKPAKHAGQTLMRCKQDKSARSRTPQLQSQLHESSQPGSADASESSSSRTQAQPNASEANAGLVSYPLAESPEPPSRLGRASMQPSEPDSEGSGHQQAERAGVSQGSSQSQRADRQQGPARREEAAHSSNNAAGLQPSQSQAERAASEHGREGITKPSLEEASSQQGQLSGLQMSHKAQGPTLRSGIRLESVEWHSRIEKDWYAATVFVDLLTFVYVALFYQVSPLQVRPKSKTDWHMTDAALKAVTPAMSCA